MSIALCIPYSIFDQIILGLTGWLFIIAVKVSIQNWVKLLKCDRERTLSG